MASRGCATVPSCLGCSSGSWGPPYVCGKTAGCSVRPSGRHSWFSACLPPSSVISFLFFSTVSPVGTQVARIKHQPVNGKLSVNCKALQTRLSSRSSHLAIPHGTIHRHHPSRILARPRDLSYPITGLPGVCFKGPSRHFHLLQGLPKAQLHLASLLEACVNSSEPSPSLVGKEPPTRPHQVPSAHTTDWTPLIGGVTEHSPCGRLGKEASSLKQLSLKAWH